MSEGRDSGAKAFALSAKALVPEMERTIKQRSISFFIMDLSRYSIEYLLDAEYEFPFFTCIVDDDIILVNGVNPVT